MKNIIDQSHDAYMNKCRRELARIGKLPKKKVTKKDIVREIQSRYTNAICQIGKTALGKGLIEVECYHGDCERIGQFVFRTWPEHVYTYSACHLFRYGRLSIYFKK